MKKQIILVLLSVILLITYSTASAEETDPEIRLPQTVCIETVGCLITPLDDAQLDSLFPDLQRFTGIDTEIVGRWHAVTNASCDEEPLEHTQSCGILHIVAETENAIDLWGPDPFASTTTRYQRIGTGVYASNVGIGDAATLIHSTQYFIQTHDNTIMRITIGTRQTLDEEPEVIMGVKRYCPWPVE